MTYEACNCHVANAAQKVGCIVEVNADYETGMAEVKFDNTKTSKETIIR